jgi:hypothetical protein
MTEQQNHLANLINQRTALGKELEELQGQSVQKQQMFYKVQGAIEYLAQIGVELPEELTQGEEAEVTEEVEEES